jgi:hypothetical protein
MAVSGAKARQRPPGLSAAREAPLRCCAPALVIGAAEHIEPLALRDLMARIGHDSERAALI